MSDETHDREDPFPFDEDEMFDRRERVSGRRGRVVPEFVRKALENTVESMQSTGSVSREALHFLLQQGDRGKRELVRIVAKEVGDFLKGVDLSSEVVKILTSVQVELNATVSFRPRDSGGVSPSVGDKSKISVVFESEHEESPEGADDPGPRPPSDLSPPEEDD